MGISPVRSRLYRRMGSIVICGALLLGNIQTVAQLARGSTKSKGPRATGLLQLSENGKPRLIPVCIMIDGRFFDAGIYKADPVPMALEGGTVYEAQRTGKPIGLFTVKNVLQQQQTKAWLAEGDWELAGAAPKKPTALQAESKPREEEDKPPTLRRPSKTASENKPSETKPASKPDEGHSTGTSTPASGSTASAPASAPSTPPSNPTAPAQGTPSSTGTATSTNASTSAAEAEDTDPNAPRLRRGVPAKSASAPIVSKKPTKTVAANTAPAPGAKASLPSVSSSAKPKVDLVPAISDADGPEPRPYTYDIKPEEAQEFRKRMLALAGVEISNYARQFESVQQQGSKASENKRGVAAKAAARFEDVNLHIFDVATNNEPIIILTAKSATAAQAVKAEAENGREYYITLVARADYNNELRKLLSSVTDSQHLDVTPRMELIDAVDADGDGRAELLFRENSDGGSAFVVYRVTPDRLWALFEGTPQ